MPEISQNRQIAAWRVWFAIHANADGSPRVGVKGCAFDTGREHGPWFDITDTSQITSVWSSHGHRFISDGEGTESCLTCGAIYQLMTLANDPTRGEYVTAMGDEPAYCTGDTLMVHGYRGETDCDSCQNAGCEHCLHDCPCVACDS